MDTNRIDQIVVAAVGVILLLGAAVLQWHVWVSPILLQWVDHLGNAWFDGLIVSILIAVMGVYLILSVIRIESKQKSLSHSTDFGEVKIGLRCIGNLVSQAAAAVPGVGDASVSLDVDGDELKVGVDVVLMPGHHIPNLTTEVQRQINQHLDETLGISVQNVNIFVKGVAKEDKARFE